MSIRVVRLGSARGAGEGLRIGTVRRPPRGVPRARFATDDWYDVWYPDLAPTAATVRLGLDAADERDHRAFVRAYRREMAAPPAARCIGLLAALSHHADFSVGCYCEDATRCHRTVLADLLRESGADVRT